MAFGRLSLAGMSGNITNLLILLLPKAAVRVVKPWVLVRYYLGLTGTQKFTAPLFTEGEELRYRQWFHNLNKEEFEDCK
jgi:hypothetical protein